MRHSSLDLNWRVPDFDAKSLELKKHLVSEFDKYEVRTYGLTFAIQSKKVDLDAIVMINRVQSKSIFKSKKAAGNFNIYHTKDFEINEKEYITFAKNVSFNELSKQIKKLTVKFYAQQNLMYNDEVIKKTDKKKVLTTIYSCKNCLTTYDEKYGDEANAVEAGTSFDKIPDTFTCSVCDAPKSDYEAKEVEKNLI
jgi:rubredoxin